MIVILGGTGRLGSALLGRLGDLDLRVAARHRPPAGALPAEVDFVTADVRDPRSLARAMGGADLVISAVQGFTGADGGTPASVDRDGNIAVVEEAERTGATVVLLSVVGAAADAPLEMMRMKHAAEARLRAGTAPWTIVRAAAFRETWVDLLTETRGAAGWPDIFGSGTRPDPLRPALEGRRCGRACRAGRLRQGSRGRGRRGRAADLARAGSSAHAGDLAPSAHPGGSAGTRCRLS